jgi:S1-C subfamily serine protease
MQPRTYTLPSHSLDDHHGITLSRKLRPEIIANMSLNGHVGVMSADLVPSLRLQNTKNGDEEMSRSIKLCSGAAALFLAAGLAISVSASQFSAAHADANASPSETTASQDAVEKKALLGVKVQSIDKDTADALGLSEPKGALITDVMPGGPADAAGLKANDAILAVDGNAVSNAEDLAKRIADLSPKSSAEVKIRRGEGDQTVKVEFAKAADDQDHADQTGTVPEAAKSKRLGLKLSNVATDGGVLIADVDPQSDAATKGLQSGDLIMQVDGAPAASAADLAKSLNVIKEKGREAVLLVIKSGEQTRTVAVRFGMFG